MQLKGIVVGYHARLPRYAIKTDYGYTVVDVEDGSLNLRDEVAGALDDHGHTTLLNESTGEPVEVCVEAIQATAEAANQLLRE